MKILFVGNGVISKKSGRGYVNKHSAEFFESVRQTGHEVACFQFHKTMRNDENLNNIALNSSIKLKSIELKENAIFDKIVSYFRLLVKALKELSEFDFVYIFYPGYTPYILAVLCILTGKKYSLYVRGEKNIDTVLGQYLISKAKFCLTVSSLLEEKIRKSNQNVSVIAPMMEFDAGDILEEKENEGKSYKKRCLFVGRIEKQKGIFELAEAIQLLESSGVKLAYDLVGGGADIDAIKNKLAGIPSVYFHGQITDGEKLREIYLKSDILIFPSYQEGFPRVLYEAMMNRVLILTTMVGGIPAVMKGGVNCLEIEVGSGISIYKTVCAAIDGKFDCSSMLGNATQSVKAVFDGKRKTHLDAFQQELKTV